MPPDPCWARAYGLLFRSDLPLGEYRPAAPATPDVTIAIDDRARAAAASVDIHGPSHDGALATPMGPVVPVPGVADFLVPDGSAIHVSPAPGHDPVLLQLFLLGSATGLILHHRRFMALHGAAILGAGGIGILVGDSGAGKSTLATRLALRGMKVMTDDVLAARPDAQGRFVSWPGSGVFKLWQDSLDALGHPTDGLANAGVRETKYLLPNPSPAPDAPAPLTDIIELARGDGPPRIERLAALDALKVIERNVYRPAYVDLVGDRRAHFLAIAALSNVCRVHRFHRPWDPARIDETADAVEAHLSTPGP